MPCVVHWLIQNNRHMLFCNHLLSSILHALQGWPRYTCAGFNEAHHACSKCQCQVRNVEYGLSLRPAFKPAALKRQTTASTDVHHSMTAVPASITQLHALLPLPLLLPVQALTEVISKDLEGHIYQHSELAIATLQHTQAQHTACWKPPAHTQPWC
jgi:hypothetical protein